MSTVLKPGDIALAVEVLSKDSAFRRLAARDYLNHPAPDEMAKILNKDRAERATADAEALGRVTAYLAEGQHHG